MHPHTTLAAARAALYTKREGGTTCPLCSQRVQVYKRHITKVMSHQLKALALAAHKTGDPFAWIDWQTVIIAAGMAPGDYSKLRHWFLVEPMAKNPRNPQANKGVGLWRMTELGWDFLRGKCSVSYTALIYNDVCEGYEGEKVMVGDTMKEYFDLEALLNGE